jgi:hypothetical protein
MHERPSLSARQGYGQRHGHPRRGPLWLDVSAFETSFTSGAGGAFHRPPSLRPARRPGQQLGCGLARDRQAKLAERAAVGAERGAVNERLWGSMPMVITGGRSSREDGTSATGSLRSGCAAGRHRPLLSQVTAGAGRARHALCEPAPGLICEPASGLRRQEICEPAGRHPGTLWATDPGVLAGIQQVSPYVPVGRPFPGENRAGCPLTPDLCGRWRP